MKYLSVSDPRHVVTNRSHSLGSRLLHGPGLSARMEDLEARVDKSEMRELQLEAKAERAEQEVKELKQEIRQLKNRLANQDSSSFFSVQFTADTSIPHLDILDFDDVIVNYGGDYIQSGGLYM